ncbi:MAG TPA: hypothetical protein VMB51_14665 [Solirubrobacteraceae bacterium]|nr:hypothetical protein [Solirubrobacteraceae bacterium]
MSNAERSPAQAGCPVGPNVVLVLIAVAFWAVCLLLVTALCAAARRGDRQPHPSRDAALAVPAPSAPEIAREVSVVRVDADATERRRPQPSADPALQ